MFNIKKVKMKKQIILATSAVALTAGSIFAFGNKDEVKTTSKPKREQCPIECCNGKGGNCEPNGCESGDTDCCEK